MGEGNHDSIGVLTCLLRYAPLPGLPGTVYIKHVSYVRTWLDIDEEIKYVTHVFSVSYRIQHVYADTMQYYGIGNRGGGHTHLMLAL